ncbi:MAG: DUF4136 domain-containing protein [Cyclobacteriaceae bacterium]|nr:DUF4136 domain-containing protein [Cyclobacteriaceae bacterium]
MKSKIAIYLVIIAMMAGCYPQGPEYYEDLDIVYTNFEETYDFASKGKYSMPDKIVKIAGDIVEGEDPEFVKEPYNTQMLTQIAANMAALGWERVDDPEDADLVLFPATWTNTTIYYWYDYWCWYYPWYCGWGWGYPSVSSYTTGTLVLTLVANGPDYIEPSRVWTAAANGLLSGSYNTSRVTEAIDQAFEQSPYLDTK